MLSTFILVNGGYVIIRNACYRKIGITGKIYAKIFDILRMIRLYGRKQTNPLMLIFLDGFDRIGVGVGCRHTCI
jgi:hypothetical protein